jgi:hypothetical protein
MVKQLSRDYLNNELWVCDEENKVFYKPANKETKVSFEQVEREGRHLASLQITVIKGYPYYHDERLREFRRVGAPHVVLTYDQFDLLPEKDQKLSVPTGDAFMKVMAKEKAYWNRRQQDADADCTRGV